MLARPGGDGCPYGADISILHWHRAPGVLEMCYSPIWATRCMWKAK